ncbi:sensor histidine kinase [Mucilaginibacter antarcticus]|uniref:Sensor histidine kinase n=1 Tax=Mucilaginibacter antarcticus TaxID=1855725 RepID=A0ABW5XTY0_9SPHI
MLRSKLSAFIIHAAGWLVFLGFPLLFMNRTQDSIGSTYFIISSPYYWLFCLTYIFLFYLNAWYLVPRFVFNKSYLAYGVIILLLSGCVYYLQPFDNLLRHNLRESANPSIGVVGPQIADTIAGFKAEDLPFGPLPHQDLRMQDPSLKTENGVVIIHQSGNIDMVGLFIFIVILGLSIAVSTVQKWQLTERRMIKAEAEKATAELSFLKAQINPHFLFNTLNNIYALSVTGNEHTSDSIMKLSNIMRYVTDEVEEDFVSLQHEWDCINDYIDLQRLRLGKKTKLHFELSGAIGYQRIAPLILMTFIENVFKYGISKHQATQINIKLTVEPNKLTFFCQNDIVNSVTKPTRTGIGIKNTRQRLSHIYPGKHRLDINNDNKLFTVNLEIDC